MLRLLNTTASRRLLGLALAGALAFSAASFAMPSETRAADNNQGCPGVIETQNGSLDVTNLDASIERSVGNAHIDEISNAHIDEISNAHIDEISNAHIDEISNAHIETSGALTASLENLGSDTNCRVQG